MTAVMILIYLNHLAPYIGGCILGVEQWVECTALRAQMAGPPPEVFTTSELIDKQCWDHLYWCTLNRLFLPTYTNLPQP